MAIDTMEGANLLTQGQTGAQNAFTTAYGNTTKMLGDIQAGREKATVNKLYGESLNADGTLDTNKLTQGMAQTGLGAKIPELLQQKQEQELNNLKLENDAITLGQSHLAYMGQLAGGQKGKGIAGLKVVKDEYRRKGWDLSRFPPDPQTDEDANGQIDTIINSSSTELERQKQDAAIQQKRDDYELRKNTAALAQATLENTQRHQDVVEKQGQTKIDNDSANANAIRDDRANAAKEKADAKRRADWNKALPSGIQKQYTEITDKETAQQGNIDKVDELLSDPSLSNVNLWTNNTSDIKNALGFETPTSLYVAKLQSGIDNIINEDLRLNKGTQTNFDYDNAKKALISAKNSNNPEAIKQALGNFKIEQKKLIETTKKIKGVIEKQYPYSTTGAEMPEDNANSTQPTKPTIQSLVDKLPAGTSAEDKSAYVEHLKSKGLQ